MDDKQIPTTWKASWERWFDSSESKEAKSILEKVRQQETGADASSIPEYVARELRCMKKPEYAGAEANIQKSLDSMTLEELRVLVKSNVATLDQQAGEWKANRQHGMKKAARRIEEFAREFDEFLAGFSGVVEVVRLVDNQYGGAASSVLFVLFATAKAKAGNDRSILSSMQFLAHRLPDLEIYYQIYADATLSTMLTKAYADVILFARKATLYFQGHGFARFLQGLAQPNAFANLEQDMARTFQGIRIRCDALVSKRIFDLSNENTELVRKIVGLKKDIEVLQKGKDEEAAREFRKRLLRQQGSEPKPKSVRNGQLEEYHHMLATVFAEYKGYLTAMAPADLGQTAEYRYWEETDASMLVLYGNNHARCANPQSWLSPVAVEYTLSRIKNNKGTDTDTVVVHIVGRQYANAQEALASIAEQLVEQQPQVLRRGSAIDSISFQAEKPTLEGKGEMLASIMRRYSRPVYILIDRLDICCEDKTWEVMKQLMNLVAETHARLKVLLVFRMEPWNVEERIDLVDETLLKSRKLILLQKHQERLLAR